MQQDLEKSTFSSQYREWTCENKLAALAQMVACLPLVQRVRGSIPGGVVNFQPWG